MKKIITSLLFCAALATSAYATSSNQHTRDWNILIYMAASDMGTYALHNITQLMDGGIPEHATVCIEIHSGGNRGWRFQVKNHALIAHGSTLYTMRMADNVINAAHWAYTTFPAHHNALILWGHGSGILPGTFNTQTGQWDVISDPGISTSCPIMEWDVISDPDINASSPVPEGRQLEKTKQILFSSIPERELTSDEIRTGLSNQDLINVLDTISQSILKRKLDLLGTDACVMMMTEIASELHPYVRYMTGAQDCELADGYNYSALGELLSSRTLSPHDLATGIVHTFGQYYKPRAYLGHYTQSAVDIEQIPILQKNWMQLLHAFYHMQLLTQYKHQKFLQMHAIMRYNSVKILPMSTFSHFWKIQNKISLTLPMTIRYLLCVA